MYYNSLLKKYLMQTKTLIFLFSVFTGFSYAQTQVALKENIKKLLNQENLSGAVWATVSDDGEITTDAYGYKNTHTKELLSSIDKVQVGSVSKTILAAGFLRMATLGLVNLDNPVQKYLPNLPIDNKWNNTNPLLVRHLLDHTSGLTDAKLWHVFSTTAFPNTPLETVYLRSPEILKIQVKPGSIYSYSNLGYNILGLIIEKITQQRYEDYLDENLLKPLEMSNSTFHFVSQIGKYSNKNLAYGHFDNGKPVAALPMYLRPAGQFTTTAEDIGKFLRFMMSDGIVNGKPFIAIDYLKAVGKQKGTDSYKNGVPHGDALGAYSRDRYGIVGIAKNGNTLGFSAMIYLFPMEKKAFFIAYNTDSETANYDLFNPILVNHLNLSTQPFINSEKIIENEINNWNGYYIPVITKVQPFGLLDYVFSHTKVETSKTGALLSPFQGKNKVLIYQGKFLFSMRDRTNVSHSFYKSAEKDLFITDGIKTIKKVSGLKILCIASSLFLGLLGLVYVFIHGCKNLIKHKLAYRKLPMFWSFVAILTLIVSIILFVNQPFMNLGDNTISNYFLAFSTLLLPILSVFTLFLIVKEQKKYLQTSSFWAVIFVLQFCVILIANKLIPVILWQ
jgi:CubicO group peptidase (beta-lactamase class C family)